MPRGATILAGTALSLALHLGLAMVLWSLPPAAELARADAAPWYRVDVEAVGHPHGVPGATRRGNAPTDAERAIAGGADSLQNVDARDRGRGGAAEGAAEAMRLIDRDQGILLFDSPLNNLAAAQMQRIRTARARRSLEHRRATPNPHDQAFLASGTGAHRERRPVSATDAAEGARQAPVASVEGGARSIERTGAREVGALGEGARLEAPEAPRIAVARASAARDIVAGAAASPGTGILEGRGRRRSEAADVAHGRPPVDRGPAATPAETRDPRVADDVDAERLAAHMMASLVDSSARRGRRSGEGPGGVGGGGAAGSGGGAREGGRATAYGPGDGRHAALDTSDARYRGWYLTARRRIYDALRFPRERALAMDQGTSVYAIVVRRDGTLAETPRLVRTSGFDDIDQAALAAIRAATPLPPLPDDLAPTLARIPVRLPIELSNPMVR